MARIAGLGRRRATFLPSGSHRRDSSRPGSVQKTSWDAAQPVPALRTTYRRHDAGLPLVAFGHARRGDTSSTRYATKTDINILVYFVDIFRFRGFIRLLIRTAIYFRRSIGNLAIEGDLRRDLRQTVENRGGVVVASYIDDDASTVRTRNVGWKTLLANLDGIDEVVVASAADLPGRTVTNLLTVLGTLRGHRVSLYLHREGINIGSASAADLLDIAGAWQRAKLSKAIKAESKPGLWPSARSSLGAHASRSAS